MLSPPKLQISPVVISKPNTEAFVIPIKLNWGGKTIETEALVDSGAEGVFINKEMVTQYGLKEFPLAQPIMAQNTDNIINCVKAIPDLECRSLM